jgi:hypothetical protein
MSSKTDRLEAWSQLCQDHYEWGFSAGYAQGRADADRELVEALAQMLGGPDCTDYAEGVRRHHRILDQQEARRKADAQAARLASVLTPAKEPARPPSADCFSRSP